MVRLGGGVPMCLLPFTFEVVKVTGLGGAAEEALGPNSPLKVLAEMQLVPGTKNDRIYSTLSACCCLAGWSVPTHRVCRASQGVCSFSLLSRAVPTPHRRYDGEGIVRKPEDGEASSSGDESPVPEVEEIDCGPSGSQRDQPANRHPAPDQGISTGTKIQKELLHEELKQFLRIKKDRHASLASLSEAGMESVGRYEVTKELKMSEMVELIVETEAEAGATGFSVAGGGKDGIFVKEVLKESRAAKALNLKEGDQLLSAKVYFDNAKYEDVLKILQSAEPYKVAFCLKRTVSSADVAISSETGSLELKGPEAKKTKLSVKSISPVKRTKKLMKEKILSKDEAAVELDVPVDVEFAFPKFSKFKRLTITSPKEGAAATGEARVTHPEVEAELSLGEGQVKEKKKKLKFPGLGTRESGKAKLDVSPVSQKQKGGVSVKVPQVTTKDLEGPEVETKTKAKMPTFDLFSKTKKVEADVPSPKAKTKLTVSGGAEVSTEGPEGKLIPGLPIKAPQVEIDIGLPKADVDVKGPSAEGEANAKDPGFKIKMPSFGLKSGETIDVKGPKVKVESREPESEEGKLKMPQITMLAIDISVPKMKDAGGADIAAAGVDVDASGYKAEGLEGKVKELAHKITTINISAPKVKVPDFDISLPKGKADTAGVEGDVRVRDLKSAKVEGEIQTSKLSIEIPEAKLKMPKVSLPEFSLSSKGKDREVGAEMEGEGPDVKSTMLKMPKFEVYLPKMKLGEAEVDTSTKAQVKVPASGVQVSKVKVDIKGPQLEGPEAKIKLPSVKMPSIDIAVPKVTLSDVQLPKGKAEISAPGVAADWKASKVRVEAPKIEGQSSELTSEGFDLQFKMPKVSLPTFGISASGKEAETTVDGKMGGEDAKSKGPIIKVPKFEMSLPKMKHVEAETRAEADVSGPGFDIMGKLPSVKMPTIDISAPKIPDVNVRPPMGKAEVSAKGVEGGVKAPKVSLGAPKPDGQPSEFSLEAPELQLKMPKVSLPSFGLSASGKEATAEVSGPQIEGKLPSVKMPTVDISALKVKIPELDLDICHPKGKAEVSELGVGKDAKVPGAKSPKTGGDGQMPTITMAGPEVTFQMPKVALPKFDISMKSKEAGADVEVKAGKGLEAEGPDDRGKSPMLKIPKFEVALPTMKPDEVDMSGPTIETDIKAAKRDTKTSKGKVDVEGVGSSEAKLKLPSMKLPTINISALQAMVPDVNITLPSVKSSFSAEGDDSGSHPVEASIEGPDGKGKMPKVSLPKFGSKSKVDGETESSVAKVDVKGKGQVKGKALDINIKGPSVDVDVDDIKLKGKEGRFKMPKFKMPTFGSPKKYEEGMDIAIPGADLTVRAPEVDARISKGKVEIKGPELETGSPEGKVKTSFMKISKFGISSSKSKTLEADAGLPSGAISSKGKMEVKAPKMDASAKARDLSIEGPDIQLKVPSFTMPSFGISGPKADMELDIKTKSGTLDSEPEGSGGKLKMPAIQMPSIGISVPQKKRADAEGLLPRAEVDVSEVDLKTYGGDLKIPKVKGGAEVPDPEGKQKLPSVKMPSIGISVPKVKAPEVDLGFSVPKVDTSARRADGEATLLSPELDDVKFKLKMPKFGMSGSKDKEAGADVSAPRVDTEDTEGKGMTFKAKMPKVDISLPKVKPSEADVGMDASLLEAEGPDAEGRFKMPGFTLPKFSPPKLRAPELDFDIKLSKDKRIDGDTTGPKIDTEGPGGEFKIKVPQVSLPSFGMSTSEAKGPGTDLAPSPPKDKLKPKVKAELKGPQVERGLEVESPEGKLKGGKIKMPKFRIGTTKGGSADDKEATKSDSETEGGKLKLKLPKFGISSKSAEAEAGVELDSSDGKVKGPKSKMSVLGISLGKGQKGEAETSPGVAGQGKGDFEADGARKSEKFKVKMPSVSLPTPDVDLGIHLPKGKVGSVEREVKAEVKGAKGTRVEGESQTAGVSSEGSEFRFKMPKFTMPDFGISAAGRGDGDATPGAKVKTSEAEVRRSKVELDIEGPEVDGKFQMLKVKMPKVEIGLAKDDSLAGGKAGVDGRQVGPAGVSSEDASTKGFFKMPTIELSAPRISDPSAGVEVGTVETGLRPQEAEGDDVLQLRMPKITLPSFGSSKDKLAGDQSSTGATVGTSVSGTMVEVKGPQVKVKGPQVEVDASGVELDASEGRLSKLKGKMSKFGVALPTVSPQEEVSLSTTAVKGKGEGKGKDVSYTSLKADMDLPDAELKTRKQLFGFSMPKMKSPDVAVTLPEGRAGTSSPKGKGRSKSPAAKGGVGGGTSPEADSAEAKLKMSRMKMPSFGISWSKSKTAEINGGLHADAPTGKGEGNWGLKASRKKAAGGEENDDTDSLEAKSKMKLKLPKVSFTPVKIPSVDVSLGGPGSSSAGNAGDASGLHMNGDSEMSGSPGKMGKIKLPKVEFSSPYQKVKDGDTELSLQLVKTEMSLSKDDAGLRANSDSSFQTSSPRVNGGDVRGEKIKAPKISFSGFKKKSSERPQSDEDPEMSNLVTSSARTELVLLESGGDNKSKTRMGFTMGKSKGTYSVHGTASALSDPGKEPKGKGTAEGQGESKEESEGKSAKFKLPKFSLGPKSKGTLEISSPEYENNIISELQLEGEEYASQQFKFQMPKVGFTTVYHEEHISEEKIVEEGGSVTVSKASKQVKTQTLTDKKTSI
uniref:neuroblast differentiation-associated protein AHNAK-like n=1 Tax=Pristiophorus japonicus TaxID=55135 RepID=UPI00398F64FD